jgi:hypothetical protein
MEHGMPDKETLGAYNIFDLRDMALRRVPKGLFEFVDRGTEDEVALRNNRAVFERIKFKPRTLVDVSRRSQEITLFRSEAEDADLHRTHGNCRAHVV